MGKTETLLPSDRSTLIDMYSTPMEMVLKAIPTADLVATGLRRHELELLFAGGLFVLEVPLVDVHRVARACVGVACP